MSDEVACLPPDGWKTVGAGYFTSVIDVLLRQEDV
jgi:hypothetical protein